MRVLAYVPDLMDRSKVAAAAPGARFVPSPAELTGADADVVVVDLSRAGVADVLPSIGVRTIGFGSHVDREVLLAAEAAGCEALPRSRFFSRLTELLT